MSAASRTFHGIHRLIEIDGIACSEIQKVFESDLQQHVTAIGPASVTDGLISVFTSNGDVGLQKIFGLIRSDGLRQIRQVEIESERQ